MTSQLSSLWIYELRVIWGAPLGPTPSKLQVNRPDKIHFMHECDVIWETRRVTQLDVKYTRSTSMRAAQSRCHTLASSVAKPVTPGLSAAFRRTYRPTALTRSVTSGSRTASTR